MRIVAAGMLMLLLSLPVGASAGAPAPLVELEPSSVQRIRLDEIEIEFRVPSLRWSRDFEPPRLRTSLRFDQVDEPRILFHGWFDGNRRRLKVIGTLRVWLDVRPWPPAIAATAGCKAKAEAWVDMQLAQEMRRFSESPSRGEPTMERSAVEIGGAVGALRYHSSYDANSVDYAIPLNKGYFLHLMFESVDNSGEWATLSASERDNFLRSLKLSGASADCG
jgi:hypothetical protein